MSNTDVDVSIEGGNPGNANLIYILYLVSIVVGITSIVGVIMAYIGRGEAGPVVQSHYNNQIGIFWKALLFSVIGVITMMFIVGFFILLATLVWYVMRVVTGMQSLSKGQAVANPGSWGFTA
jgi:uncharacterized membrane protein